MASEMEREEAARKMESDSIRRYQRYQIDVGLQVRFSRNGVVTSLRGRGSDIGGGGMSAFVPAELDGGQTINLVVTLPYVSEQLSLQAVVRNRSGFRYGLEFVAPSDRERALIERCCMALSLVQ